MFLYIKIDTEKIESFVLPVCIILAAIIIGRFLSFLLKRYIQKSARILHVDPTNYSFLQSAVSLIVFMVAVVFVFWRIPELHVIGKTLFAGAGILAAIIGFASQEAFSNIISGIFLVIYKPFSVGDNIKLLSNNHVGIVEDITLRHTILRSIENRRIVIPNSVISREQILNSTLKDERIFTHFEVTIAYKSPHNRAIEIIREAILGHPLLLSPEPDPEFDQGNRDITVKFVGLEETGVRLRAYAWTKNSDDAFEMKCDLLKQIKEKFDAEGIEIAQAPRVLAQAGK